MCKLKIEIKSKRIMGNRMRKKSEIIYKNFSQC